MFVPLLHKILAREDLTTDEAAAAMLDIMLSLCESVIRANIQ